MDSYGADFSVLFVAVCECIAVMWVYGKSRLISDSWEKNITQMPIHLKTKSASALHIETEKGLLFETRNQQKKLKAS